MPTDLEMRALDALAHRRDILGPLFSPGLCYTPIFKPAFRASANLVLGKFPLACRLDSFAAEHGGFSCLSLDRFSFSLGHVPNVGLVAHIVVALKLDFSLSAKQVLEHIPPFCIVGADFASADYVNATIPTNTPRAVNILLASLKRDDCDDTVLSRDLFSSPALINLLNGFSRAIWTDVSVLFVPQVELIGYGFLITFAVSSSDSPPVNDTIESLGTCAFSSGGLVGSMPTMISFPVSFSDSMTSELIKPIPVEKQRAAVGFSVDVSLLDNDPNFTVPDGDTVFFKVFARGHVLRAGAH